jgi:hypothetical protein
MRIYNYFLTFILVTLFASSVFSQSKKNEEEDQSYGGMEIPGYVSANFSLTSGNVKGRHELDLLVLEGQANDYMLPEIDVEVGIVDRLSLELVTGYRKIVASATAAIGPKKRKTITVNKTVDGLNSIMLGANVGLLSEHKLRPAMYLQNQFYLPKTGYLPFQNEQLGYYPTLNMENNFSDITYFDYSVGAGWDGINPYPLLNFNVSPNFNVSEDVVIYGDLGGIYAKDVNSNNFIDIGSTVTFTDVFSVDAYIGNVLQTKNFSKSVFGAIKFTFDFNAFGK